MATEVALQHPVRGGLSKRQQEQVRSTAPTDGSANAHLGKRCNSHPQLGRM